MRFDCFHFVLPLFRDKQAPCSVEDGATLMLIFRRRRINSSFCACSRFGKGLSGSFEWRISFQHLA